MPAPGHQACRREPAASSCRGADTSLAICGTARRRCEGVAAPAAPLPAAPTLMATSGGAPVLGRYKRQNLEQEVVGQALDSTGHRGGCGTGWVRGWACLRHARQQSRELLSVQRGVVRVGVAERLVGAGRGPRLLGASALAAHTQADDQIRANLAWKRTLEELSAVAAQPLSMWRSAAPARRPSAAQPACRSA